MVERQVEERTRELAALLEVSRTITSTLDLESLLNLILDQLKVMVDYTGVAILALSPAGDDLTVLAYRGPFSQEEALQLRFSMKAMPVNKTLFSFQEPLIIADVRADTPLARTFREIAGERLEAATGYLRSWLGVPLIIKQRGIGLLSLSHSEPGYYSPHQAKLAFVLANQVVVAMENARLYAETKRHGDELETVLAVQQAITSLLDSDAVLQLIADEARRLTAARLSLVYLLEGDNLRVAAISGDYGLEIGVGYQTPVAQSMAGLSIQSGHPVIVADVENDPRASGDAIRRLGIRGYMAIPLISASQPIGAIGVADKQSGTWGADEERVLAMLASGAVIGLENARLYHQEQERRREAEQRRHIAESLRDILATLNSNRSLDEIMDYIVTQANRLLGSEAVAVYRLLSEAGPLRIQAVRGLPADYVAAADIPLHQGALGQVVLTGQPIVIPNAAAVLAGYRDLPLAEQQRVLIAHLADFYQAWLAVPLVVKGEIYGGILLYYRNPRVFSEDEVGLAVAFGDQVALAIENARLRDQAEQSAVSAERNRLARDLHDAVTQTLFSASLQADVLPRVWERDPEEGRRGLEELRELARGALAEMRALLLELRPAALTEASLGELLRHLTEATTGRARLPVTLTVEENGSLPPDVHIALYRITQEALNNIAKHAKASQVSVSLHCGSEQVELRISDNGRGFDPGHIPPDHLGLGIMHERAKSIGAMLSLKSQPGQGTQMVVVWPGREET